MQRSRAFETKIKVRGLNHTRLVKNLNDEGIKLLNIQKNSTNELVFTVKSKEKAKTFAILEKLCYNYEVICDNGIKSILQKSVLRIGLVLGFVIGLALCVMLSNTVMFVSVKGLNDDAEIEVSKIIKSNVSFPSWSNRVDKAELQKKVLESDYVSSVSIQVKGNYINVTALPKLDTPKTDDGDLIVADCDAIVTRIVTKKGTPKVKKGDVVKKGETLISGDIYDTNGEKLLETVKPSGVVYGEVVLRKSAIVPSETQKKVRTGRSKRVTNLLLPWQTAQPISPYNTYDMVSKVEKMNVFIPLRYEIVTFYEVRYDIVPFDKDEEVKKMLTEYGMELVEKVKYTTFDIIDTDFGQKRVSIYIGIERIIGQ